MTSHCVNLNLFAIQAVAEPGPSRVGKLPTQKTKMRKKWREFEEKRGETTGKQGK